MPEPTKTTRRDFLQGRSAVEALGDAVIGHADLPAPSAAEASRTWLQTISRPAMACEFEILLPTHSSPHAPREESVTRSETAALPPAEAALAALDLIDRLEDQLTVYRETSEIAEINRRAAREAFVVESRLFDLLSRAVELFDATGGAFDITSGPLSKVWGFYRRQGRMPDDAEVAAALALVGSDEVTLDREHRTIRFAQSGMELNLGAIGKGYALDRATELLQSSGLRDFAIHGGQSSVIARGQRSHSAPGWTIALRHPQKPDVRLAEFRLVNQALGTSGSGTQFFHHQGKRYGHILDPRTGWPADKVLSATVIAPSAEQADALSTAFYVLGLEAVREFCSSRPEIAAVLVTTARSAGVVELHPLNLPDHAWQRLH